MELKKHTKKGLHDFFKNYVSDSMMTDKPYVYDKNNVDKYYKSMIKKKDAVSFAIMNEGKIIGDITLKHIDMAARTGTLSIILVNDEVKNKGYGTQAIKSMIDYAFYQLGLKTIVADAVLRNERSKHVLEKVGFQRISQDEKFTYFKLENVM